MRVTRDDLAWWLHLAPFLPWKFASTMPGAPHSYVVRGKTLAEDDFMRAVRVIRTFGQPGKFYSRTNVYLVAEDTRWWTMGDTLEGTIIINQADTSVSYGKQDAPSTATGRFTVYDSLATDYDSRYDRDHCSECEKENLAMRRVITRHFGAYAPTVLDAGCGTGLLLDLKVTHPALYTGVDPSQGMLNELVRKHPKVQHLLPTSMEEALEQLSDRRFDAVISLFGSCSYMEPETIKALPSLSKSLVVLMHYVPGYAPDYECVEEIPTHSSSREAAKELSTAYQGENYVLNNFQVTVLDVR